MILCFYVICVICVILFAIFAILARLTWCIFFIGHAAAACVYHIILLNVTCLSVTYLNVTCLNVTVVAGEQGVLRGGVGATSPECLSRAAMCVKLIAARVPAAIEGYRPEVRRTPVSSCGVFSRDGRACRSFGAERVAYITVFLPCLQYRGRESTTSRV